MVKLVKVILLGWKKKDYEFNGEEEQFEVEDIEIFQIGFK